MKFTRQMNLSRISLVFGSDLRVISVSYWLK